MLASPDNGAVQSGTEPLLAGSVVEVSCNSGFALAGVSSYTCGDGGIWTPADSPVCAPLCQPIAPADATVSYSDQGPLKTRRHRRDRLQRRFSSHCRKLRVYLPRRRGMGSGH